MNKKTAPHPEDLTIAIVGMGRMGHHHAQALQRIPHVRLTEAVETDPRKDALIAQTGMTRRATIGDMTIRPHAAVVATPAETHASIAVPLLERGIHCLIEKPVALTAGDAMRMTAAAEAGGALLAVGHSERFNTRLVEAIGQISEDAERVEVVRTSCPAPSQLHADVIQDLMVHDLDWVLRHEGAPMSVEIRACMVDRTGLREVCCVLRFRRRSYELRASHLQADRQRQLRIYGRAGTLRDYDLTWQEQEDGPSPLLSQAREFVRMCRTADAATTIATGEHAVAVLALAEDLRRLCHDERHMVVPA